MKNIKPNVRVCGYDLDIVCFFIVRTISGIRLIIFCSRVVAWLCKFQPCVVDRWVWRSEQHKVVEIGAENASLFSYREQEVYDEFILNPGQEPCPVRRSRPGALMGLHPLVLLCEFPMVVYWLLMCHFRWCLASLVWRYNTYVYAAPWVMWNSGSLYLCTFL